MDTLFILVGFFGGIVAIVWTIIQVIRREPVKSPLATLLICFALLLVGSLVSGGDSQDKGTYEAASNEASGRMQVAEAEYNRLMDSSENQANQKDSRASYQVTDTVFSYWQNSIGEFRYFGCVEIENTSSGNLYLAGATFDFEDNNGHLLKTETFISTCPNIIRPGEKGFFYDSIGSLDLDSSQLGNGIVFKPDITVKVASGVPVDYTISDVSLKSSTMFDWPTLTGRVTNETEDEDSLVSIYGIFRGLDGRPIAIASTSVTELESNTTKSFEITNVFSGNHVEVDDISSYEIIARKMYIQF